MKHIHEPFIHSRCFGNQAKYCKELIKRFGMENSKHLATPMSTSCYLDKDESGQPLMQSNTEV